MSLTCPLSVIVIVNCPLTGCQSHNMLNLQSCVLLSGQDSLDVTVSATHARYCCNSILNLTSRSYIFYLCLGRKGHSGRFARAQASSVDNLEFDFWSSQTLNLQNWYVLLPSLVLDTNKIGLVLISSVGGTCNRVGHWATRLHVRRNCELSEGDTQPDITLNVASM